MPRESGLIEVRPECVPGQYEVLGSDMQILNLECPPGGPKIQAAPGTMNYMDNDMKMSVNCDSCQGRCCSGEKCILSQFENTGAGPAYLGLTPSFPAKIIPLALKGGTSYRVKKGGYFASVGDVDVNFKTDFNPATCCCGGQGCIHQTISGDGTAYVAAMGTIMTKELACASPQRLGPPATPRLRPLAHLTPRRVRPLTPAPRPLADAAPHHTTALVRSDRERRSSSTPILSWRGRRAPSWTFALWAVSAHAAARARCASISMGVGFCMGVCVHMHAHARAHARHAHGQTSSHV